VEYATLRGTSRQHATATNDAQRVYNGIHKHLAKFLPDPIDFRCLQEKYNALNTAPLVIQFMALAFVKHNSETEIDVLTIFFSRGALVRRKWPDLS
jgi:hypothetical protein